MSNIVSAYDTNSNIVRDEPTHIVERTCFLGSRVGMSNVLVTDVDNTRFGQRNNHAMGTEFTWASTCNGGVAESLGSDCRETGNCDGTCVQFTTKKCMADGVHNLEDGSSLGGTGGMNKDMVLALGIGGGLSFLVAVRSCLTYKH